MLAYQRRKTYFPSLLFLLFFLRFHTNLAQLTQVFICGRFRFCHRNGGEIRRLIWKIRHRKSFRRTLQNSHIFTSFAVGIFAITSFRAHGFPATRHTLEFAVSIQLSRIRFIVRKTFADYSFLLVLRTFQIFCRTFPYSSI